MTQFDAYLIAVPHRAEAYIVADDQYGKGLVAETLAGDDLRDLAAWLVIKTDADERAALAYKSRHQHAAIVGLINSQRKGRYACPLQVGPRRIIDAVEIPVVENGESTGTLADLIKAADHGEPEIGEPLLYLPDHQAWPLYHPDVTGKLLGVIMEDPDKGLWFKNLAL